VSNLPSKPPEVAQAHRDICGRVNCEYLDKIDYSDPCSFCPNGHFPRYATDSDCPNRGDVVALIAQPIAKAIDFIFQTDIASCSGCKQERVDLNAGMSFWDATLKRMKGTKDE
jgi:hypothetical protein